MTESKNHIYKWLLPLAFIYGWGVRLRNKLFDWGWLRSRSFGIPVLCIGNLAVGGTGKTPHTEYLIRLLHDNGLNIATLSRGYKRKSKGYRLADTQSAAADIGDEPRQIKSKYPFARVAVDEDRCHGIEQLLALDHPTVDVILLDDAFQHRYVKAGLQILLTDYHRLLCDDVLLPAGRLREPISGKNRAQIVIVTKCPDDLKPIEYNIISKKLHLYPYQRLFFSHFRYGELRQLFPLASEAKRDNLLPLTKEHHVLLLTGIASPDELIHRVTDCVGTNRTKVLSFGDHHSFTVQDIRQVEQQFFALPDKKRVLITTEKDAARLKECAELSNQLKPFIYVWPIEVEFLQNQQELFNQNIIDYVRTNPRNSHLSERKDAHPS